MAGLVVLHTDPWVVTDGDWPWVSLHYQPYTATFCSTITVPGQPYHNTHWFKLQFKLSLLFMNICNAMPKFVPLNFGSEKSRYILVLGEGVKMDSKEEYIRLQKRNQPKFSSKHFGSFYFIPSYSFG